MLISKITLSTTLFDLLTHINLNDFYLNSFYYVWTQFFVLPSLIVLILLYHNLVKLKCKNLILVCGWVLVFIIIVWWILDYYWVNQYQYTIYNIPTFFNTLLQNPLNKYHPAIFFISYLFIITYIQTTNYFLSYKYLITNAYQNSIYENSIIRKLTTYWVLISISLYMGAWWALQEGSWGGWWNWDPSEVFGLIILTKLLWMFHSPSLKQNPFIKILTSYSISLIIIFTYLILQMSYTLVSHNFGLSLVGYGYVNIFFITSLTLTLIISALLNCKYSRYYVYTTNLFVCWRVKAVHKTTKPFIILIYLIILLILYLYVLSFNPILNNIFWTSVNIEVLNKWFSWLNVKLITLLVILLLTVSLNLLLTIIQIFYTSMVVTYYSPILMYNSTKPTTAILLHNTLILLFLVSILNTNTLYTNWFYWTESNLNWHGFYNQTISKINLFFENITMSTAVTPLHSNKQNTPNTYFWFSSNLETQFFLLDLNDNMLRQTIYSHVYMSVFSVSIYDLATNLVDIINSVVWYTFFTTFTRRIKIVF